VKPRARKKRAYDATGRREEAHRTTERIVEAASELLQTVRPENLSYGDVAERSGIAVRTVYRHFPEPRDLLGAVARAAIARFAPEGRPATPVEAVPVLAAFHRMLSQQPALYRVVVAAPVRSQVDQTQQIRALFADVLGSFSADEERAVAALFDLLCSPYAWEVLHTHWSLPPGQITRACLAAIQVLAEGFRKDPQLLDPSSPLPSLYRAKEDAPVKKKKEKP
jgi:AcrR family transcriptional regulator